MTEPLLCPGCYATLDRECSPDCPERAARRARPGTSWSNLETAALTPESFAEGIRRMVEASIAPPRPRRVLVGPRAYEQAKVWRADPRYAEWDDATLALSAQHGLDPLTMTPEDFLWVWHNAAYE